MAGGVGGRINVLYIGREMTSKKTRSTVKSVQENLGKNIQNGQKTKQWMEIAKVTDCRKRFPGTFYMK
jgi:hypothetical protein